MTPQENREAQSKKFEDWAERVRNGERESWQDILTGGGHPPFRRTFPHLLLRLALLVACGIVVLLWLHFKHR